MDNLLVLSSIQRIRSFLVEMCGMKVKPWASTEETLAALHTTLAARHHCGIFWDSYNRRFTPVQLGGPCTQCLHAARCRAGCTATAHAISGRPSSNAHCLCLHGPIG